MFKLIDNHLIDTDQISHISHTKVGEDPGECSEELDYTHYICIELKNGNVITSESLGSRFEDDILSVWEFIKTSPNV